MSVLSPDTLAEGLRFALDKSGLTVEELASRSRLGVSTVHNYLRPEKGRVPGSRELRTLCDVLADQLQAAEPDDLWLEMGHLLDGMPARATARTRTS